MFKKMSDRKLIREIHRDSVFLCRNKIKRLDTYVGLNYQGRGSDENVFILFYNTIKTARVAGII
jgi:hypothetical protein